MENMTKTIETKCQRCGEKFIARVADKKRGWGKFCSKSCKAIKQTYGSDSFSYSVREIAEKNGFEKRTTEQKRTSFLLASSKASSTRA